jgi:hypothetical protein
LRIGGAAAGSVATGLIVNSDNTILDDIWAWRADHGNGVGWTSNTADTGVVVNGDNVTAYGLFVEHFQKFEVLWNGNGGTDVFFQNEMPYDVPSHAAWMEAPAVDGYAAFKVADKVTKFSGYGMGSYSFFNQGLNIYAAHAFEVPAPPNRKPARPADSLPRRHAWDGRHPECRQRRRRTVDHHQREYAGHSGQLPLTRLRASRQAPSEKAGLDALAGAADPRSTSTFVTHR